MYIEILFDALNIIKKIYIYEYFRIINDNNNEKNYKIIDYNLQTMDQDIIGKNYYGENFEKLKKYSSSL